MGQSGPAAGCAALAIQLGARSAMSWRRLSLGTRVRSLRGRPVAGSVLERIGLNKGLQCFSE